ncbi:hypothetical protein VU08_06820 [Desulfobulbus sp. F5]|nr:hypothetical protein [Desulfobulbus sp. F5]
MIVKKSFYLLLVAASFSLVGSVAFAAPPVPPTFTQKLALSESKLKAIEGKTAIILSRKTLTVADENIEKELEVYAEQIRAASEEAEKAGINFKPTAQAQASKIDNLIKKFEAIESKVKIGEITLDKASLKKLRPAELNEFKKSLAPQGLQKLQKLHPDIFGGTSMNLFDGEQVVCAVEKTGDMLIGGIGDLFSVRDANAAPWSYCWQKYVACWRNCNRYWWPTRGLCRLRCLSNYFRCL